MEGSSYLFPYHWLNDWLIEGLLAFWTAFTTNSLKAPVDHVGLSWPKYTGKNGSIIVFGDDVGSQVEGVGKIDEFYPLDSC
jgi:hypothetical protein